MISKRRRTEDGGAKIVEPPARVQQPFVLGHDHTETGRIHERDLGQVQNDVLHILYLKIGELVVEKCGRRGIELARQRHQRALLRSLYVDLQWLRHGVAHRCNTSSRSRGVNRVDARYGSMTQGAVEWWVASSSMSGVIGRAK